jgi:hypothetical protein
MVGQLRVPQLVIPEPEPADPIYSPAKLKFIWLAPEGTCKHNVNLYMFFDMVNIIVLKPINVLEIVSD